MNNPDWRGPWDCAELCSWAVFQAGQILYGTRTKDYSKSNSGNPATADAYTGFWHDDSVNLGIRISVDEAAGIAGAMVLRRPTGSRRGHIAISTGNGRTIEAKGANYGVVADVIAGRRWDVGVLVPGILYADVANVGAAVSHTDPIGILRVSNPPQMGEEVRRIQLQLARFGFDPGEIDGIYGPKTEAAVLAFQASAGLVVDGEVGGDTRAALSGAAHAPESDGADVDSVDGAWSCSSGWRITGYFTPVEADYPEVEVKSINVDGTEKDFPKRFIDVVRMEGWGRTNEGWYLGYYGGRYHRESSPKDAAGRDLEVGFVAVDPRLIGRGTRLKVENVPEIAGRIFTAKDVGGAINERHIDVYCGEGNAARLQTYRVTTDAASVCVLA